MRASSWCASPWWGIPLWGLRAGDSAGCYNLCDLFHVERWGLAYIPSAGLCGRRVIFVECPLVVRAERSGCVCSVFFVEVVRSLGLLLVTFVFSVVGCCAFWRFGVASLLFIAGASCLW